MFTELETRKRSIIYIRAILTLIITLLGAYQLQDILESRQHVGFFIVTLIASNFVFMLLPSREYDGIKLNIVVFILDIVFITLGAYWLAELDFMFFMMIFVTVFISALGQSVRLGFVAAIVVNIFYFFIKAMMAQNGVETAPAQAPPLLNIPFLFMVAIHASYMAERAGEDAEGMTRVRKSNQALTGRVNDMYEELDNYKEYTDRVFDAFREGVIILDQNGVIRQFNRKCESIFGVKRGKAVNFLYKEVKELGDVIKVLAEIIQKHQAAYEKEMTLSIGGELIRININTVYINDKNDQVTGYMCTIKQKITGTPEGV